MRLYAVTDRACLVGRSLPAAVSDAIEGGATCIQLREKEASEELFESLAHQIKLLCERDSIPFIVNDNVEVSLAVDADGVHVGQEDMACEKARESLGNEKIVGVSVQTLEQALIAEKAGADYLGVGALFGTPTKPDAIEVDSVTLKEICAAVSIPVVGIGGLNERTIPQLAGSGVDGAAVVSAIFAAEDVAAATKRLRECIDVTLGIKE